MTDATVPHRKTEGLPGNPMMWLLIAAELMVFGGGLLAYAGSRALDPHGFLAAQDQLDRLAGTINTAVLLTSGLFAALAVTAREAGRRLRARLWLAAAGLLGVVFLIVKAHEYATEIAAGHDLDSGGFFTLYFLITGFHAVHVIFGIAILALVAWFDDVEHIETGAAFWHMVDLVWVVVFPTLYLLR
ncbi:MAG: cytochrome c oxidase subunit 3 family protein [Hyphomicrobiales bacterium]|nr:cytochrome c oxidase subunit 3 family protein [Hyphomicrobiales bacterium]